MNEPDPKILEDTSPDVSPQEEPQRDSLETILARPGVKEMMEVYGNWHELNKIVDTHLSIVEEPVRIITSNSSRI